MLTSKHPPDDGTSVKFWILVLNWFRSLSVKLTAFGSYPQAEQ